MLASAISKSFLNVCAVTVWVCICVIDPRQRNVQTFNTKLELNKHATEETQGSSQNCSKPFIMLKRSEPI